MAYQKKSYKKFVATAASATLVASAIVPVASAASFSDVEEKHEFATYIDAAVEAGYVKGYADGTFGVNDNLKRSQVVIIIGRYLESLGYDSVATTSPWSDVTDAEVIKYGNIVKDAGVFTGYTDGTLKGNDFITRENMAVVLDRLAETVTGMSLSDVAEYIEDIEVADLATANAAYQSSIQALRDLEISTADNFNPKGNLKRGQFAKFIINAVEAIDALATVTAEDIAQLIADVDATLPAVEDITADSAEAAKATVEAAKTEIAAIKEKIKVTGLTGEEVAELEKAIEAVEAKFAAIIEAADKAIEAAKPLAVESVTAINSKTLTVKGEGLAKLKAEDITVAGNTVAKVEASEDGKTATVTLAGDIAPNKDTKVSVKVGEETKEFTVNYAVAAKGVAVVPGVFDDNRANQRIAITVDGVATSIDYLLTAGYTVEFKAYNANTGVDATSSFFRNVTSTNVSNNGYLLNSFPAGNHDFKVQVILSKDNVVTTSELVEVSVRNLDNTAVESSNYLFVKNGSTSNAQTRLTKDILVVGETAHLDRLVVTAGDSTQFVNSSTPGLVIKSSNPAVISVDASNQLTAVGVGTTTLTVSYGNVTKTINYEVKGELRKVASVVVPDSVTAVVNATGLNSHISTLAVQVLDQYGNPFNTNGTGNLSTNDQITYTLPSSVTGLNHTQNQSFTTNTNGRAVITLPVNTAGQSGTAVFKDEEGKVLATSTIKTTAVADLNKVEIKYHVESLSQDDTLNPYDATDSNIIYDFRYLTSENVSMGNVPASELEGYKVKFDNRILAVRGYTSSNTTVELNGTGVAGEFEVPAGQNIIGFVVTAAPNANAGSTSFAVLNKAGQTVANKTVTLNKGSIRATGVTWKSVGTQTTPTTAATAVNHRSVLEIERASTGDDVLKGITLSSTTLHKVRIDNLTSAVYLDRNDNAEFDLADDVLGTLAVTATPSAANLGSFTSVGSAVTGGFSAYAGYTYGTGTVGNLVFKLVDPQGNTIGSTLNVPVNVKASSTQQADAQAVADFNLAHSTTLTNAATTATVDQLQAAATAFAKLSPEARGKIGVTATQQNAVVTRVLADSAATATAADFVLAGVDLKGLSVAAAETAIENANSTTVTAAQTAVDALAAEQAKLEATKVVAASKDKIKGFTAPDGTDTTISAQKNQAAVTIEGDIKTGITVKAPLNEMDAYLSSNDAQNTGGVGNKWVALVINTGFDSIIGLEVDGYAFKQEDVDAAKAVGGAEGTFVLFIKADDTDVYGDAGRTLELTSPLGAKVTFKVKVENTSN